MFTSDAHTRASRRCPDKNSTAVILHRFRSGTNSPCHILFANRTQDEIAQNTLAHCLSCFARANNNAWDQDVVRNIFETGQPEQFQCSDSESKWCDVRVVPIRIQERVTEVMVLITDISDKRQLENQAAHHARLASLGVLAAGVAHEINNPNNAVLFNAAILQRGWPDIEAVLRRHLEEKNGFVIGGIPAERALDVFPRLLEGMKTNAHRIATIVESLKHLARHDPGEMNHLVDLADVIRHSLSIVQHQVRRFTDHFVVELPERLPNVLGNSQQLEQVVLNLLLNACQSLADRSARVALVVVTVAEDQQVILRVSDTGKGIQPKDLDQIFKPFYTTRPENGGLGLGLSIVSNIVLAHKGRIEVSSTPGQGTVMSVFLPIAKPPHDMERGNHDKPG
ncbi:MAG: hypothetical protein HQL87_18530 [Magnetococcales bacterium]|nr:hypothetical protein [Magnetococcales bacterium]